MILPGGHQIRSIDVGVLLSAGILELEVVKKPVVAIFPTGTEIIEPGAEIKKEALLNPNSRMFENMVQEQGAIAKRYPILEDVYEVIRDQVKAAVQCSDMVIASMPVPVPDAMTIRFMSCVNWEKCWYMGDNQTGNR